MEMLKKIDQHYRMPIVDEKAPRECDFDAMVDELKGVDANTACVFNCQVGIKKKKKKWNASFHFQMGKGRTTTGMIVACLIKDLVQAGEVKDFPLLKVNITSPCFEEFIFFPFQADKNELPDEEEFLEEEHR